MQLTHLRRFVRSAEYIESTYNYETTDVQMRSGKAVRAPSTALTTPHPATTLATAALAAGILCATALATAALATRTLSDAHLLPPTFARHRRQLHHAPATWPATALAAAALTATSLAAAAVSASPQP